MKKAKRLAPEKRIGEILKRLKKAYPEAKCSLNYSSPFELLVATILSAQCTDERVNKVTKTLFQKYRQPADYLAVVEEELQNDVRTTGFFRNKTRSIRGACQKILDEFKGNVPATMDELLTLPGVARKTANVVMGNAYNTASGVVVDTHVGRIAQRLKLTRQTVPEKIENDLMKLVPKKDWVKFSHMVILHGRAVCKAIKPDCPGCVLSSVCPSSTV